MAEARKVLIVDDSPTSRQIIRNYILKHRRGWDVFESDNGEDAMQMIETVSPDFVTMDVNMPNMSGLEAAERILQRWPGIRMTLITANVQEAVRRRARDLGIGFIEKPVRDDGVRKAIDIFEKGPLNG